MKQNLLSFLVLFLVILAGCSSDEQAEETTDRPEMYPNAHLLVTADDLQEELTGDNPPLLIDARDEIQDSVIAGAVHFPAVSSLIDPDHPIEYYLTGPDRFGELMRGLGLDNDSRVVIYDSGNALSAARLFYALDYYGFSNASVLNGGIRAWQEQGYPLAEEPAEPGSGTFTVNLKEGLSCDFEYVVAASQADDKVIFDTRSEAEYTGEDERAEKSGHIPNAVHLEWSSVLEPDGIPYFRPASDIQEMYTTLGITPDKEVIPHCHTNVRGSHAYFTLRLMGYDSVRPYEGSWADYGNREEATVSR